MTGNAKLEITLYISMHSIDFETLLNYFRTFVQHIFQVDVYLKSLAFDIKPCILIYVMFMASLCLVMSVIAVKILCV